MGIVKKLTTGFVVYTAAVFGAGYALRGCSSIDINSRIDSLQENYIHDDYTDPFTLKTKALRDYEASSDRLRDNYEKFKGGPVDE
ncbi:MAG: hypothetical protein ACI83O_000245 [Patescibacteria group bacterium]|jgi:hypothetical protein